MCKPSFENDLYDETTSPLYLLLHPIYDIFCQSDDVGCPSIVGGRYNCSTKPPPYGQFLTEQYKDALRDAAKLATDQAKVAPFAFDIHLLPVQQAFFKEITRLLNSSKFSDHIFASVLFKELPNGILPTLKHMCRDRCHKSLYPAAKTKNSNPPPSQIPNLALMRGRFIGKVPFYLKKLSEIEKNMIARINPVIKLILSGGKFHMQKGEMYTIVNNIFEIRQNLPVLPSLKDTAILRHKRTDGKP